MSSEERPADIDPVSGCRLPLPDRGGLDAAARQIYDGLADPKGGSLAGLAGPGGVRLHSPTAAVLGEPLTRYLRFESGLSPRLRELAILVTARGMDSRFEWAAHEDQALKDGVPPAAIEAVKHGRPTDGLEEEDAEIVALGRELLTEHRVRPETFARVLARHGRRQTVDIVLLMGNYAATALLLAAVDAQVPPEKPQLPIPQD